MALILAAGVALAAVRHDPSIARRSTLTSGVQASSVQRRTRVDMSASTDDEQAARLDYERYRDLFRTPLHEVCDDAAQASDVVRVENLLSAKEIEQLLELADSTAADDPSVVFDRSGWSGAAGEAERKPHWQVVFLQANHVLQNELPHITRKLIEAARAADAHAWNATGGLLDEHIGIRCAEVHTQQRGGGLPDPQHRDHGSLLTLDLMLSEEGAFEGGEFTTFDADGRRKSHDFSRGSALIFLSLKRHGVRPVVSGVRRVLVVEFWQGVDVARPGRDEGLRWYGLERAGAGEPGAATCPWQQL